MSKFTKEDDDLLGELGIEEDVKKKSKYTSEQERIIAGFEEIQQFIEEHGREPRDEENNDIFERLYAVRLEKIRSKEEYIELLLEFDQTSILK